MFKLFLASLFFVCIEARAFPCQLTFAKDSCWTNYDVTLEVIDQESQTSLFQTKLYEGKSIRTDTFECKPGQELIYKAIFSPVIWVEDKGRAYYSQGATLLPKEIHPGDKAWTINVCFATDFAKIPTPPTSNGHCACHFE